MIGSDIISTFNDLMDTCHEVEQVFRAAAQAVEHPELQTLFNAYAQQRGYFARELEKKLEAQGASIAGSQVSPPAPFFSHDPASILKVCERAEDKAASVYRRALSEFLPAEIQRVVQRQYARITEAHEHIRSLRDSYS